MKTSLTSVTFRKKTIEEIVSLAVQAGLDAIEWGGDIHVPPTDSAAAAKARRLCKENGLAVSAYGTYYRCSEEEDFAAVVDTAIALGTNIIRVWAGHYGSAECSPEARSQISKTLAGAVAMAAEKGCIVATEYHANTLTDNLDSTLQLLEDVPGLYTYWQPGTTVSFDPAFEAYSLKKLGKKVVNVHVFHRDAQHQKAALAEGFDTWVGYFRELEENCAVGYGAIEFVKDDCAEQFLADAKSFRDILAAV